jgi:hypothetical protein
MAMKGDRSVKESSCLREKVFERERGADGLILLAEF